MRTLMMEGRQADSSSKTNKTFVMIIQNRNLSWETIDFPNACALLTHPTQAILQPTTKPPKHAFWRVWGLKKPGGASGPDGTRQPL